MDFREQGKWFHRLVYTYRWNCFNTYERGSLLSTSGLLCRQPYWISPREILMMPYSFVCSIHGVTRIFCAIIVPEKPNLNSMFQLNPTSRQIWHSNAHFPPLMYIVKIFHDFQMSWPWNGPCICIGSLNTNNFHLPTCHFYTFSYDC